MYRILSRSILCHLLLGALLGAFAQCARGVNDRLRLCALRVLVHERVGARVGVLADLMEGWERGVSERANVWPLRGSPHLHHRLLSTRVCGPVVRDFLGGALHKLIEASKDVLEARLHTLILVRVPTKSRMRRERGA